MEKDLLTSILQTQMQLKLFHWQTSVYNKHIIFGQYYKILDELFDKLVETYSGKYKKLHLKEITSINVADIDMTKLEVFFNNIISFFSSLFMSDDDKELRNIVDEIISNIYKMIYLLNMN